MYLNPVLVPRLILEDLWKIESGGKPPRPNIEHLAATLLPEATELIHPVAILNLVPILDTKHNWIFVEGGYRFQGAEVARLLASCDRIALAVLTLGSAIDQRVDEYFRAGQPAHAYLLDSLGNLALSDLTHQICEYLEGLAAEIGEKAGFPLSPGHGDWAISALKGLLDFLDAGSIGVNLTLNHAILPRKSVSFVVGLGAEVLTTAADTQCKTCSLQDTCLYQNVIVGAKHPAISSRISGNLTPDALPS